MTDATGSLLGRKLVEHVPEFAVELVRLLQHPVMADTFDGDRTEVGVLLVGLDGRGGEGLLSAGGADAPHRHLGLREQLPRALAEEVAHEGDRHPGMVQPRVDSRYKLSMRNRGACRLWRRRGTPLTSCATKSGAGVAPQCKLFLSNELV